MVVHGHADAPQSGSVSLAVNGSGNDKKYNLKSSPESSYRFALD